ncbi:MCE family protein [Thiohalocapsa marina]|uniref:MCE family protein n=1 Tax=Thiohalocapsa marina TaxID=424902 RepID=A0A5M8FT71_9GAMM|nr:MlaD family protein [Thiohalocapsa marina]KAA6186989.1 MCE family protein [Thiohalocapsa marina]
MPDESNPLAPAPDPERGAADLPEAQVVRRDRLSLVWLLPILAVLVGAWLVYQTLAERGPRVTIEFAAAAGLQAGKTKVRYKDVDIGTVTAIEVSGDLSKVIVTAELVHGAEKFLTDQTRFWVARPRVTASRVSGLETLLSGAYVALDPVPGDRGRRHFIGLTDPPVITTDEPGTHFSLRSNSLGSLNLGSPVYHRQIQVGQVVEYALDDDGSAVTIDIFVASPYDRLIYANTRFWNASGVDLKLSADGVSIDTQSLISVLIGGVAFDTPETLEHKGTAAGPDQFFPLYANRDAAHERVYLDKEHYLLVFGGSVRGLSIGAPVLLRGIRIGQVLDIRLTFEQERLDFVIPVLIEVEPERIGLPDGTERPLGKAPAALERLVQSGLRAQLKTGNLLTGQLYVELDFHQDAPPARLQERDGFRELPTLPTPLEAAATKLNRILTRVDAFPLEQIGDDLSATMAGVREVVESDALRNALADLEAALAEIRGVSEQLDNQLAPELGRTLQALQQVLQHATALISPEAALSAEVLHTMRELSAAARSVRVMADYLERHPEALIQGKGDMR